jgi:hypothetical protein
MKSTATLFDSKESSLILDPVPPDKPACRLCDVLAGMSIYITDGEELCWTGPFGSIKGQRFQRVNRNLARSKGQMKGEPLNNFQVFSQPSLLFLKPGHDSTTESVGVGKKIPPMMN